MPNGEAVLVQSNHHSLDELRCSPKFLESNECFVYQHTYTYVEREQEEGYKVVLCCDKRYRSYTYYLLSYFPGI